MDKKVRPLREWRERVFFQTQTEFAARIGVNVSTLSLWETGKRHPRLTKLREVAARLGIEPWQIELPEGKVSPVAA